MSKSTDTNNTVPSWSLDKEAALDWTEEDDTVVPGHHKFATFAFTWGDE